MRWTPHQSPEAMGMEQTGVSLRPCIGGIMSCAQCVKVWWWLWYFCPGLLYKACKGNFWRVIFGNYWCFFMLWWLFIIHVSCCSRMPFLQCFCLSHSLWSCPLCVTIATCDHNVPSTPVFEFHWSSESEYSIIGEMLIGTLLTLNVDFILSTIHFLGDYFIMQSSKQRIPHAAHPYHHLYAPN